MIQPFQEDESNHEDDHKVGNIFCKECESDQDTCEDEVAVLAASLASS